MRERYHCGDVYPALPNDLVCLCVNGHAGPHNEGSVLWTSEESIARRMLVEETRREARERAEHNARIEALGGKASRGGLVGNRQQRRVGLRRGR